MLWTTTFVILIALITHNTNHVTAQDDLTKRLNAIFGISNSTTEPTRPPDAPPCECVPYYQCKGSEINTNGEGIIDIR